MWKIETGIGLKQGWPTPNSREEGKEEEVNMDGIP